MTNILTATNYIYYKKPPTKEELLQQIKRTIHISSIWCNAHMKTPTESTPENCGWSLNEGEYYFHWFDGPISPSFLDISNIGMFIYYAIARHILLFIYNIFLLFQKQKIVVKMKTVKMKSSTWNLAIEMKMMMMKMITLMIISIKINFPILLILFNKFLLRKKCVFFIC